MLKKLVPEIIKAPLRTYLHSKRYTYSQVGQDFWVFAEVFNEERNGFFVDIGAYDGVIASNSYILEKRYGWRGICVEANPDSFKLLQKNRSAICANVCLDERAGFVIFEKRGPYSKIIDHAAKIDPNLDAIKVRATTFMNLLKELDAPRQIDYLSIDIEGAEERVLKDFSFSDYQVKCITIELPTAFLRGVLEQNGFALIKEIPGIDCFYLRKDLIERYVSNVLSFYDKKRYLALRIA